MKLTIFIIVAAIVCAFCWVNRSERVVFRVLYLHEVLIFGFYIFSMFRLFVDRPTIKDIPIDVGSARLGRLAGILLGVYLLLSMIRNRTRKS